MTASQDLTSTLLLGAWETVLAGLECDAIVTDPPYGHRTHAGHDSRQRRNDGYQTDPLPYSAWGPDDVTAFVRSWSGRTRGWMAAMTSHDLIPAWHAAYLAAGRYAFAPVPCVTPGLTCRLAGDGPSSWAVYLMVARPRTSAAARWGTLPGAYLGRGRSSRAGGKPLGLMRQIIRDYSRRGDRVCDPCAGHGTTLVAARAEGRRYLGAEVDDAAYAHAAAWLAETPIERWIQGGLV